MSPGSVFDGFGFPAVRSSIQRIPIGSAHISAAPMMFSLPGIHTHWFVPERKVVMLPWPSISTTVASFVTHSGPDSNARRTFAATIASAMWLSSGTLGLPTLIDTRSARAHSHHWLAEPSATSLVYAV